MHVVHFDRVFEDPINAYIVLELCSNNVSDRYPYLNLFNSFICILLHSQCRNS